MKIARFLPPAIFAPAIVIALFNACGTSAKKAPEQSQQEANVTFALANVDFSSNSVRICGEREPPADAKYRCFNDLIEAGGVPDPNNGSNGGCLCFDFDETGNILDPASGQPAVLTNLCPSIDANAGGAAGNGDWTFSYTIFNEQGCVGTVLNDAQNTRNFQCFDARDIVAQASPNATVEALEPGLNANHVVCATTNARKSFNFTSCANHCSLIGSTQNGTDVLCTATTFSCGCTSTATPPTPGSCMCPGGPTQADLTNAGCRFNTSGGTAPCDIVCGDDTDPNVCMPLDTLMTTATCGLDPDYPVMVGTPTSAVPNCAGVNTSTFSGSVVSLTTSGTVVPITLGSPAGPPIQIADGQFFLTDLSGVRRPTGQITASNLIPRRAYSKYQISWTATDANGRPIQTPAGAPATTTQMITVRPKIQAAGDFILQAGVLGTSGTPVGGPSSQEPARLQDEVALTKSPLFVTLSPATYRCNFSQTCCQGLLWNSGSTAQTTTIQANACSGMLMSRPAVALGAGGLVNNDNSREMLVLEIAVRNLALATPGMFTQTPPATPPTNPNTIPANAVVGQPVAGGCTQNTLINASNACPFARAPDSNSPNLGPQLPPLPMLESFPASSIPVGPDSVPLPPGSYGAVTVPSGGTLTLGPGNYSFASLNVTGTVFADKDTRVYVNAFASNNFASAFLAASGGCTSCPAPAVCFTGGNPAMSRCVQRIFLGYTGTNNLTVTAPFLGTFVASPTNATTVTVTFNTPGPVVTAGTPPSGTPPAQFLGSFYAPNMTVMTGSELECGIDTPALDQISANNQ